MGGPSSLEQRMHLLYLDESGSGSDCQHFVLAGVSFFERSTHWAEQKLNEIVSGLTTGGIHELELHGAPMHGGRGVWRRFEVAQRQGAICEALRVGVGENRDCRLFGAVIKKDQCGERDVVELAFEELCRRFDIYLAGLHRRKDTQRGIMILDKSSTELRIQKLARTFKYDGHAAGKTRNYAEVPLFLDSKASRLIQLADLVAYAMFQYYERSNSRYFDVIRHRFHGDSVAANQGLCELLVAPPAGTIRSARSLDRAE